jgi:hypothetical protein
MNYPETKVRRDWMKRWILWGATLLFAGGVLTGCSTQGQKAEPKAENLAAVSEEKTDAEEKQEPTKEEKVFQTGETAAVDGLEITVQSAVLKNGNKYIPPEKGKVLAVQFQLANQKDEPVSVGVEAFNLYDEDGNALQSYFSYDDGFMKADLQKGETKKGVLYFDVPQKEKYVLLYKPNLTDEKEIKFEVALQHS